MRHKNLAGPALTVLWAQHADWYLIQSKIQHLIEIRNGVHSKGTHSWWIRHSFISRIPVLQKQVLERNVTLLKKINVWRSRKAKHYQLKSNISGASYCYAQTNTHCHRMTTHIQQNYNHCNWELYITHILHIKNTTEIN